MPQHLPESDLLVVHEEVREALDAGVGVVALESTILAHGLPHPDNIEIGGQIEGAVRAGGSVPATIAVLEREGVHGKDVTPRLLEYFHENSGGESLRANVELVLSNARLAGEVAAEIVAQCAGAAGAPGAVSAAGLGS